MEAVGVALGGISLVISALDNCRTCATFFDDYANHEALIIRKRNYLWIQKEQLEVTLTSIGIRTPRTEDDLRTLSLDEVATHLRRVYPDNPDKSEKFANIIQHMNEISEAAASKLNGGSSTQSKWPGERVLGLKRKIRKIRLSLDGEKGELTSLLNELQMWNLSLKHCLEKVEIPSPGSIHDRAVIAMHEQFSQDKCDKAIESAQILHEALTCSWSCTCNVPHEGCLRLSWHATKTFVPARFEMALSCEVVPPGTVKAPWKTVRITVDTAELYHTPLSKPSPAVPPIAGERPGTATKGVKKTRFADSVFKQNRINEQPTKVAAANIKIKSDQAPSHRTLNHITRLCSSIVSCDQSVEDLGHLTGTNTAPTKVYVHNTPVKPSHMTVAPIRTHEHQFSGLTLPSIQRLEIAASICWAVLLLSNTDWLSADLTQSELQLFLNNSDSHNREELQGAYVSFRYGTPTVSIASLPASLASDSTLAAFTRNRTLFVLGIMLIELCLGRSFENLKADPSITIGTRFQSTPTGFGDFDPVSILVDKVHLEVGDQYGNAVQRCLRCPFDGTDKEQDLKLPQFRKNFFRGVIAPIQATYNRYCGRV